MIPENLLIEILEEAEAKGEITYITKPTIPPETIAEWFIEQMGNNQEYGDLSQRALVNLASEMAKKQ